MMSQVPASPNKNAGAAASGRHCGRRFVTFRSGRSCGSCQFIPHGRCCGSIRFGSVFFRFLAFRFPVPVSILGFSVTGILSNPVRYVVRRLYHADHQEGRFASTGALELFQVRPARGSLRLRAAIKAGAKQAALCLQVDTLEELQMGFSKRVHNNEKLNDEMDELEGRLRQDPPDGWS